MKRTIQFLTTLLLLALLAACGAPAAEPASESAAVEAAPAEGTSEESTEETTTSAEGFPRTITDGQGRELTFDAPPERVIPYFNGSFGHLATLGIMPIATGANPEMLKDPIYLADGESIPRPMVDGTMWDIDLEKVASYEPDLIMAWNMDDVDASGGIASVYLPSSPDSLAGVQDELRNVASIFGMEEKVEEIVSAFNNRVDAYATLSEENADMTVMKLSILGDGQFSVATTSDPVCQMLDMIATCAWEDPTGGDGWGYDTSIEGVLSLDPDIIIFNSWVDDDVDGAREEVQNDSLFAELTAVKNEMVFSTPGYENPIASNLPAAQKVLDTYIPQFFPEAFPDGPLTDEQVADILGLEAAEPVEVAADGCEEGFRLFVHFGGETCIPADPQRIVTTQDQNGMLPLIELGVKPAGSAGNIREDGSFQFRRMEDYDTEGVEFIGSYWGDGNFESIAAVQPDLIVSHEYAEEYYDLHGEIAPTVMIQIFERPLSDALMEFADLAGRTAEAEALQAEYQARVDGLLEALGDRKETLSISLLTAGYESGGFGVMTDGGQAVGTVMWDLDLLRPDPQQVDTQYEEFSIETLSDHDADVVLVFTFSAEGQDPNFDAFMDSPLLAALNASQAEQIYVIDGLKTVGSAWGKMTTFVEELETILLDPDLDVDVVQE
ncbi:MAG: ABC transporter substrate-binding protein [Chloroflexota bacterium]